MKRKSVQVKAHFFALTTVGMLFFDCFFGLLIYDHITHSPTWPSFSNPNDAFDIWFSLAMISVTLVCAYAAYYFSKHEKEKQAIWIDGEDKTSLLGRIFVFFMLLNLPLLSLWSSNFFLALCIHIILFFADIVVLMSLRWIKKHRKPLPVAQTQNSPWS